jgi:hypothetical protein
MTQKTSRANSGGLPEGPAARKKPMMMMNSSEPKRRSFPSLPIINNPQAPPRSLREKYGTLFYLGILGLAVLLTLVGWFGYRLWSLRDVWANVYVLNDVREPDALRIQAAYSLGHDPRVEQRQLWDLSLRRGIPELARVFLAEGIGPELVAEDPQGYVTAVARSPDWPDWLRLALARPLAYAASRGHAISRERLGDLCRLHDPVLRLWALYALAVQPRPDPQTKVEIEQVAKSPAPERELADLFLAAISCDEPHRLEILDRATLWNRDHHAGTARLWQGWAIRGSEVVPSAPK